MAVACVQRRLYEMTLTSHTGSMRTVMVSVSKSDGWITNRGTREAHELTHMWQRARDNDAPCGGGGDFAETATSDVRLWAACSEVSSGDSAGKRCLVERRDDNAHGVAEQLHCWHMQGYDNNLASWVLLVVD